MKKSFLMGAVAASVVGGQAMTAAASTTYQVKSGDTLYAIGLRNNLSVNDIKSANHLTSDTIYPGQSLVLGTGASNTSAQAPSAATYTIQSGDTLSKIAADHQMSVAQIAAMNGISNVNFISVGQVLKVNGSGTTPNPAPANPSAPANNNSNSASSQSTYTVKAGDTLSRIAATQQMSLSQLAALNGISNVNLIRVGQVLKVSGPSNTSAPAQPNQAPTVNAAPSNTATYTVVSGDTLSRIASEFHMSLSDLASLNKIANVNAITVGQVLQVSAGTSTNPATPTNTTNNNPTPAVTPTSTTGRYTVKSGDTLYAIAARLGVNISTLLSLNGLNLNSVIYVGQTLITAGTSAATPVAPVTPMATTPTNATPGGVTTAGLSATQAAWLQTAVSDAKVATAGTGVLASVTVAQAILESGWGQSTLGSAPYHNLFGIKQGFGWTGAVVNLNTSEFVNGQWTTVVAPFRAYSSQMASFQDHTNFLLVNSRYAANGVINAKNYVDMANGLQAAGYATAPTYASALIGLVERYNLQSLDY